MKPCMHGIDHDIQYLFSYMHGHTTLHTYMQICTHTHTQCIHKVYKDEDALWLVQTEQGNVTETQSKIEKLL